MQLPESANHVKETGPDIGKLALHADVLREESPGGLAWWLPGERERGIQHWDRINIQLRSAFLPAPAVIAAPAAAVALRQVLGGALFRLWRRARGSPAGMNWAVPGGGVAEQNGNRRIDLLVAGGADAAFDVVRVRELWPKCSGVRRLGPAFFLVEGIQAQSDPIGEGPPAEVVGTSRQLAGCQLAIARSAGDRGQEVVARIDLALLLELQELHAKRATSNYSLEEAK